MFQKKFNQIEPIKKRQRWLAAVLTVCMMATMLPASGWAEGERIPGSGLVRSASATFAVQRILLILLVRCAAEKKRAGRPVREQRQTQCPMLMTSSLPRGMCWMKR